MTPLFTSMIRHDGIVMSAQYDMTDVETVAWLLRQSPVASKYTPIELTDKVQALDELGYFLIPVNLIDYQVSRQRNSVEQMYNA